MMARLGPLYREREFDLKDRPVCIANFDRHIMPDGALELSASLAMSAKDRTAAFCTASTSRSSIPSSSSVRPSASHTSK
jgi:hypothetical protein